MSNAFYAKSLYIPLWRSMHTLCCQSIVTPASYIPKVFPALCLLRVTNIITLSRSNRSTYTAP